MHKLNLSTRWVKIARDFWIAKGRVAMMVLAIAAGVFAVTTILGGYTILTREVSRNYQSTNPASASLEVDNLDEATLTAVRARPGIAAAEAMAAGVPILVSDQVAIASVAAGHDAAFVVATKKESIRAGLLEVLRDETLRERLSRNRRNRHLRRAQHRYQRVLYLHRR